MDANKLMSLMKEKKQALKQKEKTLKPSPGTNRYVILPGWRKGDEQVFWHDFGQHYVKNAAGEIQAVYPCADKTYGEPCPICSGLASAVRTTTDDDTLKVLKEAAAGQSYLLNVLALDADDPATPVILEVRKSVFGQIVETMEDWGAAIFDPETPQIVQISRDGKGLNTKYSVQISAKKHALPKGVLAKLHNLDEYVKQESEEQQRRALSAINSVAGLLPPPSGNDKPRTLPSSVEEDDDALSALADQNASKRAAAASKPAPSDISLDDDLEDLLGGLTGTDD